MSENFWIFVVLTSGLVLLMGIAGIAFMGWQAYKGGAMWDSPEGFTSFATQLLRITTVLAIVGTVLILTLRGDELKAPVAGILSGIAGYVLGGSEKPKFAGGRGAQDDKSEEKENG